MAQLVFSGHSAATTAVLDAYEANIVTAGGTLSAAHRSAAAGFVSAGLRGGWWSKIIDCNLFLGSNLAASLVKVVAAEGAGESYGNTNVANGDYAPTTGITVSANATKYLSTGIIPGDHGLSTTNLSVGFGSIIVPAYNGQALFGCDEADEEDVAAISATPYGGFMGMPLNRCYASAVSFGVGTTRAATDAVRVQDAPSNSFGPRDLDNELEIFRTSKFGTKYLTSAGNICFFFVGENMSVAELLSITAAARRLHVAARSIDVTPRDVFLGDSITVGQGVGHDEGWAEVVQAARSSDMTNLGWSGTTLTEFGGNGNAAGINRYFGTVTFPISTFFVMFGSNDIAVIDQTNEGDPVVIAAYRAALTTMANDIKAQGAQVVICSIPWTERAATETKLLAWVDAALGAAEDADVIGVDTCRPMIATEEPEQFLIDDVHPNAEGHAFIAATILDALS